MYRVVRRDLETDTGSPALFFRLLANRPYSFLLESVIRAERVGRYSFIGLDADRVVRLAPQLAQVFIPGRSRPEQSLKMTDMSVFRRLIAPMLGQLASDPDYPLASGLVGYIGYDMVRVIERLPNGPPDRLNIPLGVLVFPRTVLAFDHLRQRLTVFVHYRPGERRTADARADSVVRAIRTTPVRIHAAPILENVPPAPFRSNMPRARFLDMVKKAKAYIRAGDIFQVVLSQQFRAAFPHDPLYLYRALRMLNPSPYMFQLNYPGFSLVGSSPEILVKLKDRRISIRPIAGTRPRGKNEREDARLERELLADKKERAEHLMLLDLGRNDVGEVARFGTVTPSEVFTIERYSAVMHIVSHVEGELRRGKDAIDVLSAAFPAGTVSGAPKVRAMQIIDELEPERRGSYAGAVGYFGAQDQMDFAITIRTVLVKNKIACIQAGAGVVHDSVPAREFDETHNKARALLSAVGLANAMARLKTGERSS